MLLGAARLATERRVRTPTRRGLYPVCAIWCAMPFDSPHWTLAEAIVWIATRDQRRVDALNLITRNSLMRLYTPDKKGSAILSPKEVREAQAKLINALGAAKLIGTGIVMAEGARKDIPGAEWANIRLSESQRFSRFVAMAVTEAAIDARLEVRGKILREWKDVRVSCAAVLGEWPQDSSATQALSTAAAVQAVQRVPPTTTLAIQATSPGAVTAAQAVQDRQGPAHQTRGAQSEPAEEDLAQRDREIFPSRRLPSTASNVAPDVEESAKRNSVPEAEKRYPSVHVRKHQLDTLMCKIHAGQIPLPPELTSVLQTGQAGRNDKAKCSDWIKERLEWPTKSRNDTGDKEARKLLESIAQAGGLARYVKRLSRS
jgi:hypothetical protein